MLATNDAQVDAYIQHKLKGYTGAAPSDYLDVAQAALEIAAGNDLSDVSQGVLDSAMYVVSPDLYTICGGNSDVSACVSDWGSDNSALLASRLTELRARAQLLDISSVDFATNIGADTDLTFLIDSSGMITGVSVDGINYTRIGNSNIFNNGDTTITYNSGTRADDWGILGLSYSDFGVYQIATNGVAEKNIPFAGGYESKKIAENNIQSSIDSSVNFYGAAVGTVTNETDETLNIVDNRAVLNFSKDTGASTLTANFADWYNIVVTKDMNSTDANIVFSGYTGSADFQLSDGVTNGKANMNVGYYGPNPDTGIPTEATGLVGFTGGGLNMDVSFGVK